MKELFERKQEKVITISKNLDFKEAVEKIACEISSTDLRRNMLDNYLQCDEKQECKVKEQYLNFSLKDLVEDLKAYGAFRHIYKVEILQNLAIIVVIQNNGNEYYYDLYDILLNERVRLYEPEEEEEVLKVITNFKYTKEYNDLYEKNDNVRVEVREVYL